MNAPLEPLRVLTADPPWPFADELPGAGRGAEKHYPTLSMEQIKAFPLPPMDPRPVVLVLWKVAGMPQEALDVVRAWGFTAKAELVWIKTRTCTPCGGTGRARGDSIELCKSCRGEGEHDHFGMGRTVRNAHETAIIATRGARCPERLSASERSWFRAPVPQCRVGDLCPRCTSAWKGKPCGKPIHSAKPDAFFEKIERLFPGPYGELFARRARPGWWQHGNEIGVLAASARVAWTDRARGIDAAPILAAQRERVDQELRALGRPPLAVSSLADAFAVELAADELHGAADPPRGTSPADLAARWDRGDGPEPMLVDDDGGE